MPIYQRRSLRQRLGREWLRDIVVGQTSGSWGTQAGSYNIIDSAQADPTASGEQMYFRHHLRLLGSAGFIQDLRIGTFNTGSGAFVGAKTLATAIFSGMPYEVHGKLSPAEKDLAIDAAIQKVRVGPQEFPLWSIDNGHTYSLGTDVYDVLGGKYFSDPTHSLDKGQHGFHRIEYVKTATGQELRIWPALPASYQIVLDAILEATLGAGDLATVWLPSDDWVLWGAAARCFWQLEANSPAQEAKQYKERRAEAANAYTKLSARFQPKITRKIQLDAIW